MNHIYQLAITCFRTQSSDGQKLQINILKDEIEKQLIQKNDSFINEAIAEAQNDNKTGVVNLIEEVTQNLIDVAIVATHEQNLRSDMFLIPVITKNSSDQTKLPALSMVETTIQNKISEFKLAHSSAQVFMAPIVLNSQTAGEMQSSKWYALHNQIIENISKRNLRPVFNKPFLIKTQPNYPTLNFLIGIIVQNKSAQELLRPIMFKNEFHIEQDKNKIIVELQKISHVLLGTDLTFLKPNSTLNSLIKGYNYQQDLIIEAFINAYKNNLDIEFAVLSIDKPNTFVILPWHKPSNKILNCFVVEPLNVEMQENVDKVMDYMAETDKLVYLGNSVISANIITTYQEFDFNHYLNTDGATILQAEDVID